MSNGLISIHKTKILLCWNALKHQIQISQNLHIEQSIFLLNIYYRMSNGLISIHKTKILLCWNAFKHQIQLSQNLHIEKSIFY